MHTSTKSVHFGVRAGTRDHRRAAPLSRLLALGCVLSATVAATAADKPDIPVVYSSVSQGYTRTKLAGGAYKPETYAFADGGYVGAPRRDFSIDSITFQTVATAVVEPLAHVNYVQSKDPKSTDLLIVVYWGVTAGVKGDTSSAGYQAFQATSSMHAAPRSEPATFGRETGAAITRRDGQAGPGSASGDLDAAFSLMTMENRLRDRTNFHNARILGYADELASIDDNRRFTVLRTYHHDLIDDVEESRYFIVLMAYDFQSAWKEKKLHLRWVTRLSIPERGNNFGGRLPDMIDYASRYFGADSHGLVRNRKATPRVDFAAPTVIELDAK